jgi:hypothetical protein
VIAALLLFGAAPTPPSGIYSQHTNATDTLQRSEDNK